MCKLRSRALCTPPLSWHVPFNESIAQIVRGGDLTPKQRHVRGPTEGAPARPHCDQMITSLASQRGADRGMEGPPNVWQKVASAVVSTPYQSAIQLLGIHAHGLHRRHHSCATASLLTAFPIPFDRSTRPITVTSPKNLGPWKLFSGFRAVFIHLSRRSVFLSFFLSLIYRKASEPRSCFISSVAPDVDRKQKIPLSHCKCICIFTSKSAGSRRAPETQKF